MSKPMIEPITGRYMQLELWGTSHRIYWEESGQGIPLLCLHTAGSDGRQFRALMNDEAVTAHYRVIALDMPWHGKSSPPAGWEAETYELTTRKYLDLILAISSALELDRPVVMGCSIGGRVVLHLAREHPDAARCVIGLQSAGMVNPYYDIDWLYRPDVHGAHVCAGMVSGLIAPTAPSEHRWETLWHYMQGGPGIFKGDLHFYTVEGDIMDHVGEIDTARCPIYMLTGEYDFSCSPEMSQTTADAIEGAKFQVMEGMGHFPMSEHPEAFKDYLMPVLDEIRADL
ncbi:MAG: alpha/beta hydrolase [Rhizobiales bacterium]|nr:alpha/beta hydrolase [Hyphomicrobiales bacterium]